MPISVKDYDDSWDHHFIGQLIRESIQAYCIVDHCGDKSTIDAWIQHGVNDFVNARHRVYAEDDHLILGIAAMTMYGRLMTNYVVPAGQSMGVSNAMLDVLELRAKRVNVSKIILYSTAAARPWYMRRGYVPDGRPVEGNGVSWNFPLVKAL